MHLKSWALTVLLLVTPALASPCTPGTDCQKGTIAGPFSATQVAEFSTTNPFPICVGCTSGSWSGVSIEGIDAQQNIGTSYAFYDDQGPNIDDNIAVGPTVSGENAQVLEWLNNNFIQAFDKVTGQPIFTSMAGGTTAVPANVVALWSATTQPECHENGSGNVQVIFDRSDGAFVISRRVVYETGGIHEYAWCIAASSSSDLSNPATQWYAYEYRLSTVIPCTPESSNCTTGSYYYFPDWPRIGTWSNGFYITFDLQDPNESYIESGIEACQLDRADIVAGNPTNPMTCYTYTIASSYRPILIHSVDVADIDSSNGPASGEPEYFLAQVNPSNSVQGDPGLRYCTSQTTPCYSTQLAMFTWGASGLTGPTFLSVNSYTPGCYNTSKANQIINTYCVPEPSTNSATIQAYGKANCGNYSTPCLDSLGDRLANRLTYNNLSTAGGPDGEFLTVSHVVTENSANMRTGIRYYVIQVSNGNASVVLNSGGTSGPPDLQDPNGVLWYFMPSAALDQDGNLGFTFTTSGGPCSTCSTQPHPALNFDVLPRGATSFDTPTLIVQGTGDQENTDRFGEYAATVIDSTDNLTFYGVGEYYDTNQTGTTSCSSPTSECYTWQTRIFRGQYGNPF